ncbi:MAG TPA: RNA polymerase sigma factor [Candidatus Acidoferrales bacterium]|nr:RNA polymerase sigma factor [Candidatus Acidoferrales bacterium]
MDTHFNLLAPNSPPSRPIVTLCASTLYFTKMATDDDLRSIAAGLRRRDPEIIDRLIDQYQHRLFRYLVYLTASRERAEDFFQETWIRVLERGHQYDGRSRFDAWLFSIARHLVIDWQRQKKVQSLDSLLDPKSDAPLELSDSASPSPLCLILSHEETIAVQASLERVPAIYREVLLLRFQEDMPLSDIAAVLAVPLATVKSRLYRGLENLRSLLMERQHE